MSRAPPFPGGAGQQARAPPLPNGNGPPSDNYQSATRPLQIGRPSRPTTPSSSGGPARPTRSDMRMRQASEYSVSDAGSSRASEYSTYGRDSSARSDAPRPPRARNGTSGTVTPASRMQRDRAGTNGTMGTAGSETEISPTSPGVNIAMSAFRSVATRNRTNGADGEWENEREREWEVEQARQQRIRDRAPGRRPTQGRAKAGDIDAVLDQIKDEWEFVIDPDFNPVDLALQLLDDTSQGKDANSFKRTKELLGRALKGSVDRYHQAFAGSLPQHSSLFNHLDVAQTQIKDARTALQESKDALGNRRADLVQIWSRGQTIEEMIRILDQIEHLKTVADALESLIAEKRFLQASVLLVRSLKIVNNVEMQDVSALSDLRSYFTTQETALREILVDEIHSHLYLKSFWCESRWASYVPNQQSLPKVEFEEEPIATMALRNATLPPSRRSRLARFLDDLALRTNESPYDTSDLNVSNGAKGSLSMTAFGTDASNVDQHPEADSFAYLEMLLESLAVLGKLGSALDIVAQRLSSEIYSLVESTVEDVSERAEYGRRASALNSVHHIDAKSQGVYMFASGMSVIPEGAAGSAASYGRNREGHMNASSLRLSALESSAKHMDHEVLQDLFWTLYSKFDAVLQGLRVVYEVANRIGSRRDFKDSSGTKPGSLFPLAEIWLPVNGEVRTLLQDYITDEEQGAVAGRNPISSINEVLRDGRISRDRSKPVFRFADTAAKWVNTKLKSHEEELNRALKDTVPGLVQSTTENAAQLTLSAVGNDDRMLGVGQHHRLLIKPDTFHVSVLFQPTLAFLERVSDVLPSGLESARASTTLLDDFVLKVYLPQLEEKVSSLFYQAVSGPESFQADPVSFRLSSEPLVKASTQLMALINSLCAMLRTAPFHRENHARLILGVVIQFYQRCYDRFQLLVSTNKPESDDVPPEPILAAQWAQTPVFTPGLAELLNSDVDATKRQQLSRQETQLELGALGQAKIRQEQLVTSMRNLSELCMLYRSVAWFAAELSKLKTTSEEPMSPATSLLEPVSAMTPSLYTPLPVLPPIAPDESLTLPLSRDMALRFHALLKTYDILAELILYTVRIDVRCRAMYYLDLAMAEGVYHMDHEVAEPDPHIVDLNSELGKCDDAVSSALAPRQQRFVFEGLGQLMEHLLIANTRFIRSATVNGIKKLLRNTLALQQSIKTLTSDDSSATEFERAKRYYALFFLSPTEMLEGIRQKQQYSFDEYKSMLALQCGVDQTLGDAGAQNATDRNYSSYVIDLHGLEMDS